MLDMPSLNWPSETSHAFFTWLATVTCTHLVLFVLFRVLGWWSRLNFKSRASDLVRLAATFLCPVSSCNSDRRIVTAYHVTTFSLCGLQNK